MSRRARKVPKPLRSRLRDFLRYRSRRLRGWLRHSWLGRRLRSPQPSAKLHIGCGACRLDGWINVDLQRLPEVDLALDVTRSFPFADLTHVFAEHFLEHLDPGDAIDFLVACHHALVPSGCLRLSTPNLDWVWTHLDPRRHGSPEEAMTSALHANRAFHGWGHRLLWNRPLLAAALEATGYTDLHWCRYGDSAVPEFRGLERHDRDPDDDGLEHVLVVDATRAAAVPEERLTGIRVLLDSEFSRFRE
jgi:hypothetical protein